MREISERMAKGIGSIDHRYAGGQKRHASLGSAPQLHHESWSGSRGRTCWSQSSVSVVERGGKVGEAGVGIMFGVSGG
jgi:hypothetical protein